MNKRYASWRRILLAAALLALATAGSPALAAEVAYSVKAELPHDPAAFTQGLLYDGGFFYESTGLNGRSSLRKVEPATGRVLVRRDLDQADFGEGLALHGGKLYQLTWRSRKALLWDAATLAPAGSLPLDGEGWGIAVTPFGLVTSDGTSALTWRDPASFKALRRVEVKDGLKPVTRLNELEWVDGHILANVWHEDRIAVIAPGTGKVAAWIDCAPLRKKLDGLPPESDLNGLAWDPATRTLYVTGKLWPKIFALSLEALPKP